MLNSEAGQHTHKKIILQSCYSTQTITLNFAVTLTFAMTLRCKTSLQRRVMMFLLFFIRDLCFLAVGDWSAATGPGNSELN